MLPPQIMGRGAIFGVSLAVVVSLLMPSASLAEGIVLTGFSSGIVGGKSGAFPLTSAYVPADAQIAVGAREVLHLTNGAVGVYRKTGEALAPLTTLDQFWNDAGLSDVSGTFDPRVVYDPRSQRYYASSLDSPQEGTNANHLLLAVSKSSDPLDGWQGYKIPVNINGGDHFGDADGIGFNGQNVFLSLSSYQSAEGPLLGTTTLAIDKSSLLSLSASLTMACSYERSALQTGFSLQPIVDYDGGGTAADVDGAFIARYFNNSFAVSRFTGSLADNSALYQASGQNLFVQRYAPPPAEGATQKGTATTIDAGDNILASSVIQRGGMVYLVQGVSGTNAQGNHAAIRLLVYRAADNAILLDTLISDPIYDMYFPSVAVNDNGAIVIGYTGSGPDEYASAYAVIGTLNAARNAVAFETPLLLAAGQGTYNVPAGGSLNRWGDYSATWIDPTDPTKFWTAQEYAIGKDQWGTYIAEISVGGVTVAPEPSTIGLCLCGGVAALTLRRVRKKR